MGGVGKPYVRSYIILFAVRGPVFSLSNISTNKCKWRKSRRMMVIMPSIKLTKAKEIITCTDTTELLKLPSLMKNKTA